MTEDNLPEKKAPSWASEVWDRARFPLISALGVGTGAAIGYGAPKLYNAVAAEKGWAKVVPPPWTHTAGFALAMGLGISGAEALARRARMQAEQREKEQKT